MSLTGMVFFHVIIILSILLVASLIVNLHIKKVLAEKTAHLNATLNTLPDMLFEINALGNCIDYKAPFNADICIHSNSFTGRNISEVLSSEALQLVKSMMEDTLKYGTRTGESFPVTYPAGKIRWFEISMSVKASKSQGNTCFIVLVRDITARKETELALKKSEERFRFAAMAGQIGLWDYDSITGEASVVYNYNGIEYPSHLSAGDFQKLVHPEDLRVVQAAFKEYFEGKRNVFDILCRIDTKKIGWQWMMIIGLAVEKDKEGKVLKVAGYLRNFTNEKKSQETLMRAKISAEASSQAKSEFIANMSHEIRTPLNAILGLGRILLHSGVNSKQYDYLQKIQYSAENLLNIVNDILDFSSSDANRLVLQEVRFDLYELINKTAGILFNSIKSKGLRFDINLGAELPLFYSGDPGRITQVLMNLLGNAVKFTEKGSILLSAALLESSEQDALLQFVIEDTGIGISPEQMSLLFQPFSQGDPGIARTFGGTGLGLVISKNLVEKMGGSIGLESRPGEGSSFTFTIRLRQADNLSDANTGASLSAATAVLLLKDRSMQMHVKRLLAMLGIHDTVETTAAVAETCTPDFLFYQSGTEYDSPLLQMSCSPAKAIAIGTFETQHKDLLQLIYPFGLTQLYSIMTGPEPMAQTTGSEASQNILVVDDNEINLMVAEECIKNAGHRTDRAFSGQEALDKLKHQAYDIIFMDLHMPVMDGLETSGKIRELQLAARPVIIALTADIDESIKNKALNTWFDDYMTKPFEPERLSSIIHKWGSIRKVRHLDIPAVLKRLTGNYDTYLGLLEMFVKNNGSFVEDLQAALEKKDYTEAALICHTMKGLAGNIGANSLYQTASAAVNELRAAAGSGLSDSILASLREEFGKVYETAASLAEAAGPAVNSGGTPGRDELEDLIFLAERNDFEAFERFKEARVSLMAFYAPEQVKILGEAIAKMDWKHAVSLAEHMKSSKAR